jgi:hypothetical protein
MAEEAASQEFKYRQSASTGTIDVVGPFSYFLIDAIEYGRVFDTAEPPTLA